MYDEFERAVTGKSGERLSFLAWLSIALGTLFVIGVVGAGLVAVRVRSHVAEMVHVIQHELEVGPTLAAEAMVERLESHASLLSVPPEEGVMLLQDLADNRMLFDNFIDGLFANSLWDVHVVWLLCPRLLTRGYNFYCQRNMTGVKSLTISIKYSLVV